VDASSVVVLEATDRRFAASVCEYVPGMRFAPPEFRGVSVPVRVHLPFTFDSQGRRGSQF
jgi:hypothetical protein